MPKSNKVPDGSQQIKAAKPGHVSRTAIHSNTNPRHHNFDYASRFSMNGWSDKIKNFLRNG